MADLLQTLLYLQVSHSASSLRPDGRLDGTEAHWDASNIVMLFQLKAGKRVIFTLYQ